MSNTRPALSVSELTVRFGSLVAVDRVSFNIAPSAVVGLVGMNGAGKSTLLNAIAGACQPANGSIVLGERDITHIPIWRRARLGIARTFQNLELFDSMTAADNLLCCHDWLPKLKHYSRLEAWRGAYSALEEVGLGAVSDRYVGDLSYAERKLVEFARALIGNARVLLLDEPTAGVALEERAGVVNVLRSTLKRRPELSVLVVEHDMAVIEALCDLVHVMASGTFIFTGTASEMMRSSVVREAYLGDKEKHTIAELREIDSSGD